MIASLLKTVQKLTIACGMSNRRDTESQPHLKLHKDQQTLGDRDTQEGISCTYKANPNLADCTLVAQGEPGLSCTRPNSLLYVIDNKKELIFSAVDYPGYQCSEGNEEYWHSYPLSSTALTPVTDIVRVPLPRGRRKLKGLMTKRGYLSCLSHSNI